MSEADAPDSGLDLLLQQYAERRRSGEQISIGEYAAEHPDHADQLKEVLPALMAFEDFANDKASRERELKRLGDYKILRLIGRGGMGAVYEALHTALNRKVALKMLSDLSTADDDSSAKRFVREAKAVAALSHDNIIPVLDVGTDEGTQYFTMPLLSGRTLQQLILDLKEKTADTSAPCTTLEKPEQLSYPDSSNPDAEAAQDIEGRVRQVDRLEKRTQIPLPFERHSFGHWMAVARIGQQVAEALEAAHRKGIIHRDIKPSNIMLDEDNKPWVIDFGLAKIAGADLTRTGMILGTFRYMAPEQCDGTADACSDVFSLGMTLYELATLKPAVESDTPRILQELRSKPRMMGRAGEIVPEIPKSLDTVIFKATATKPEDRYQSAEAMAEDLRRVLSGDSVTEPKGSLSVRRWIGLVALIAVVIGVAAFLVTRGKNSAATSFEPPDTHPARTPDVSDKPDVVRSPKVAHSSDREVATWVLQQGGQIHYLTGTRTKIALTVDELPTEPFHVLTIILTKYDGLTRERIATFASLPEIMEFVVNESNFDERWLELLLDGPSITSLQLAECNITDAGAETIGQLTGLAYLGLNGNHLTNAGVAHLAGLTEVSELKLNGNLELTDACLQHLSQMEVLELLDVQYTQISETAAKEFAEQRTKRVSDFRVLYGDGR